MINIYIYIISISSSSAVFHSPLGTSTLLCTMMRNLAHQSPLVEMVACKCAWRLSTSGILELTLLKIYELGIIIIIKQVNHPWWVIFHSHVIYELGVLFFTNQGWMDGHDWGETNTAQRLRPENVQLIFIYETAYSSLNQLRRKCVLQNEWTYWDPQLDQQQRTLRSFSSWCPLRSMNWWRPCSPFMQLRL